MHYSPKIAILYLLVILLSSSCFKKVTCPAYQSQYLLDEELKLKRFSLFEEDSIPKPDIGDVKKNKFGIAANKFYYIKMMEIKNLEMITIYPELEDSIEMATEPGDTLFADADTAATMATSPYLSSFNYDQLIYNTLFGSTLESKSDSREEIREDLETNDQEVQEEETEKPGFFKRLFGKKDKQTEEPGETGPEIEDDPVQTDPPVEQEPDQAEPQLQEEDDGF